MGGFSWKWAGVIQRRLTFEYLRISIAGTKKGKLESFALSYLGIKEHHWIFCYIFFSTRMGLLCHRTTHKWAILIYIFPFSTWSYQSIFYNYFHMLCWACNLSWDKNDGRSLSLSSSLSTHTYTYTHMSTIIYAYEHICICVCFCMWICIYTGTRTDTYYAIIRTHAGVCKRHL